MTHIEYSRDAVGDLDDIWHFLAANAGVDLAERFVDRLEAACETIALSPLAYRQRPEFAPDIRSFPFRTYVIFYFPDESGISVVRILHASRDIESIFE